MGARGLVRGGRQALRPVAAGAEKEMIDEEVGATSSPPMRLIRMRGLTP